MRLLAKRKTHGARPPAARHPPGGTARAPERAPPPPAVSRRRATTPLLHPADTCGVALTVVAGRVVGLLLAVAVTRLGSRPLGHDINDAACDPRDHRHRTCPRLLEHPAAQLGPPRQAPGRLRFDLEFPQGCADDRGLQTSRSRSPRRSTTHCESDYPARLEIVVRGRRPRPIARARLSVGTPSAIRALRRLLEVGHGGKASALNAAPRDGQRAAHRNDRRRHAADALLPQAGRRAP